MIDPSHAEVHAIAAGFVRCAAALRDDRDPDGAWSPETDPDQAAYDTVNHAVRHGPPEHAWALVRAVLQAADDAELAYHAAGPLEDLVRHHATALVDVIEAAAAQDERFQWALGQIWMPANQFPPEVEARLVRASGGVIKPFL